MLRYKINIMGAVQGVGFRPFVYRLAKEMDIKGLIQNTPGGVYLEAEGEESSLTNFLFRLQNEKPAIASIYSLEYMVQEKANHDEFRIMESQQQGKTDTTVLPDIAVCKDCLQELFDPGNRRYRYPFINCTHCGPRFSIINNIPYDRSSTSMKIFTMCPVCQSEYDDPANRRFHAQPNACPVCGPSIEMWDNDSNIIATGDQVLLAAASAIHQGKIIALKGIGGFQLVTDARNKTAVEELRKRKRRYEKPFAVMYPSLDFLKADCHVSIAEERLLLSPASPILLLAAKEQSRNIIADNVASNNPYIGAMLPYSPLHHLLMYEIGFPVVATSGNLNDEPICIDEYEALDRLKNVADAFVVHDRPIVRQVDDSVVRIVAGREQVIRRARGYAPLPIRLDTQLPPMLAVGGHLKNTVAVTNNKNIFISQHIGNLENGQAYDVFKNTIGDLETLYEILPIKFISDLHPEYLSTKYAQAASDTVVAVQHHYAHVLSCMADNDISGECLGISWDGTGLGTDGTIWGSEFLLIHEPGFERLSHFRNFLLPGADLAVKQPARTALGMLYEILGDGLFDRDDLIPLQHFTGKEKSIIHKMLANKINSPVTCSAGRVFDAVASIIGLRQQINFEGQAAMELEFAIQRDIDEVYSYTLEEKTMTIDWQPLLLGIINDLHVPVARGHIAAKFHNTLVEMIVNIAQQVGQNKIILTGGCFQNAYLTERSVKRLTEEGFRPYWHQRIPPNDGGISAGQLVSEIRRLSKMAAEIANNIAVDDHRFVDDEAGHHKTVK